MWVIEQEVNIFIVGMKPHPVPLFEECYFWIIVRLVVCVIRVMIYVARSFTEVQCGLIQLLVFKWKYYSDINVLAVCEQSPSFLPPKLL